MIRLNPASTATKRRSNRSTTENNDISDLICTSNAAKPLKKSSATTPESDRLFEELLGDDASDLVGTDPKKRSDKDEGCDDDSSAMSSIFSGLLDKYKLDRKKSDSGACEQLGKMPEGQQQQQEVINDAEADLENGPSEGQPQTLHQQRLQLLLNKNDDKDNTFKTEEGNEEDTLITKPREIAFDPLSDDVSALFGGGGVSTAHQVESYMGTYAKQRQNRRKGAAGGGGLFGGFGARSKKNENSDNHRGATSQYGVDSILEDIGVRSAAKSNYDDSGDESKGHTASKRHFRSTARNSRGSRKDPENSIWKKATNTTTLVLMVIIVYVMLQIPTVQKHDRMAMKKIKDGMHKYDRFQNGGNYDDGTGEGHVLRRQGMHRREKEHKFSQIGGFGDAVDSRLRGVMKQSNNVQMDLVDDIHGGGASTDDMAILSKKEFNKHPIPDEHDDKKAALMRPDDHDDKKAELLRPPEDIPEQPAAVDKLNDIDPVVIDPDDGIPAKYRAFADLKTPYVPGRDTPYFWHIPRSGGVIVKTLMSHCLRMTLAAEVGELEGHDQDEELKVVLLFDHNYTNVNVATAEGIQRALSLGLVPSHLADVIVSAQVDKIPSLFTSNEHARAFVMFRNPIDRAASMFYFLQSMGNERLKNMTLDDYAKSDMIENNWLVRILSDAMTGPIDAVNLETAQLVLKRKFIVGILDNRRGSFARFDHYFKWKENPHYEKEFGCIKQVMDEKYTPKHPLRKGDVTWNLIFEQNRFDMQLYEYAKELFKEQSSYIFGL